MGGAAAQKRLRERRRADGECTICGRKATPSYRTCAACRTRSAGHHQRYRDAGLCPSCGRRKPEPGYASCYPCRIADYERYHGGTNVDGISAKIESDLDPRARYVAENVIMFERDCEWCGSYMALTQMTKTKMYCNPECKKRAMQRRSRG